MRNTDKGFCSLIALSLAVTGGACSSQSSDAGHSGQTLPQNWFQKAEDMPTSLVARPVAEDALALPNARADAAVENAFKANVAALTDMDEEDAAMAPGDLQALAASEHPADWVPWHLDGMVGYFAITQNGSFGPLLYSGTQSVKATWMRVAAPAPAPSETKKPDLKVTAETTAADLPRMLEPAVRSVMATRTVQNESKFRANLQDQGEKFLTICRALESIKFQPGWHVEGYQLNLSVSASGQVMPATTVGGVVNLYFDWYRNPNASAPALASTPALAEKLRPTLQLIASEVSEAVRSAQELKKHKFDLDMIQLGLGMTAGGTVGVASASGGMIGRVLFKKDAKAPESSVAASSEGHIDLIEDTENAQHMEYARKEGVVFETAKLATGRGVVYKISRERFRKGLSRAIKMATYFTKKAHKADSRQWNLTQIEAEFDLSLGGSLQVASVAGIGQFVLDFDRVAN